MPATELLPAVRVPLYRKSPIAVATVPEERASPVATMAKLTPAQPRRSWRWLDATSCVIDDPASVSWLAAGGDGDGRISRVTGSKIDSDLR